MSGPGCESDGDRTLLVDASVFITLAAVDGVDLPTGAEGLVVVPERVAAELTDDPATTAFEAAREAGDLRVERADARLDGACTHLGRDEPRGDAALLALALESESKSGTPVVVTDDKPLRTACKALSIPLSGSIGVLVRAVERGDVDPGDAKDTLYAMDAVGARLSASLVRRAERLIDEAADSATDGQ